MQVGGDPNAVLKDLHATFEDTVQQVRPSLVPKLCQTVPSDGAYEKYVFPTAVAQPRQFSDERVPTGVDVVSTYQLNNNTYELTLDFDGDLLADARAYNLAELVREAAMSAVLYPDYLLSSVVAAGVTAGSNAYDGNTFYGDTHLYGSAGANNIDNKLAGSGTTLANLQTDIGAAIAALRGYKDNAGRLINQQLAEGKGQLLLQCPLAMEMDFRRALNTAWLPVLTGASGENVLQGVSDIIADGYLTDANDWYLHYVGLPLRPYVFQERSPLVSKVLGYDSEFYTNTRKIRIAAEMRFKIGYFGFYRSVLTVN